MEFVDKIYKKAFYSIILFYFHSKIGHYYRSVPSGSQYLLPFGLVQCETITVLERKEYKNRQC